MEKPEWAAKYNLELCGHYYQGFVDDYEAALSLHKMETVTSYGVRKSRKNHSKVYDTHEPVSNAEKNEKVCDLR